MAKREYTSEQVKDAQAYLAASKLKARPGMPFEQAVDVVRAVMQISGPEAVRMAEFSKAQMELFKEG